MWYSSEFSPPPSLSPVESSVEGLCIKILHIPAVGFYWVELATQHSIGFTFRGIVHLICLSTATKVTCLLCCLTNIGVDKRNELYLCKTIKCKKKKTNEVAIHISISHSVAGHVSYFLGNLAKDIQFFFKVVHIANMNTYIINNAPPPHHREGKQDYYFLFVDL